MNKLKLIGLAAMLATGIAQANPCDNFKIKVKNNLAENLIVTHIRMNGAEITPNQLAEIGSKGVQEFTLSNSSEEALMTGEMVFHTLSLPSRTVKINFDLQKHGVICEHNDRSPVSDYTVDKTRIPGKGVDYTILNK